MENQCITYTGKVICFYLGKPCRYGQDAPPEEQMECLQCPVLIMWMQTRHGENWEKFYSTFLNSGEPGLDSEQITEDF